MLVAPTPEDVELGIVLGRPVEHAEGDEAIEGGALLARQEGREVRRREDHGVAEQLHDPEYDQRV